MSGHRVGWVSGSGALESPLRGTPSALHRSGAMRRRHAVPGPTGLVRAAEDRAERRCPARGRRLAPPRCRSARPLSRGAGLTRRVPRRLARNPGRSSLISLAALQDGTRPFFRCQGEIPLTILSPAPHRVSLASFPEGRARQDLPRPIVVVPSGRLTPRFEAWASHKLGDEDDRRSQSWNRGIDDAGRAMLTCCLDRGNNVVAQR